MYGLPLLLIAPMLLGVVAAPAGAATGIPSLRVRAATHHVTVVRPRHRVAFVDPGFFVSPVGGTFELKLNRATLADPITFTQVWTDDTGEHTRILPRSLLRGWNGLRDFFHLSVRNSAGRVVRRMTTDFCPNSETRSG